MVKLTLLLMGVIVLQTLSEVVSSENDYPVVNMGEDFLVENSPNNAEEHGIIDKDTNQRQRQKRFYDYMGFGYPSYNFPPSSFPIPSNPHYSKRDESQNTGVYGTDNALNLIYRRLQQVVRDVSQQNIQRPPQPVIPAYIPFLYIPQIGCGCNSPATTRPLIKPTSQPTVPQNVKPLYNNTKNTDKNVKPLNNNTTNTDKNVTIEDRFPIIDDAKQNWGLTLDKTDNNNNNNGDGSRPINLDPIPTEEPLNMPVPPVEHGTVQVGANTVKPLDPQKTPLRPPQNVPKETLNEADDVNNTGLQSNIDSEDFKPSLCDGAILSCCNQPRITAKCFEVQGCNNPSIYGSPCDPNVQLMVVTKFQNFHKQRTG